LLNIFKIRRIIATLICSIFPAIFFYMGLVLSKNLSIAFISMGVCVVLVMLLSNIFLLSTTFRKIEEGDGIAVLPLDSTGIANLTLCKPKVINGITFLEGKTNNAEINDIFDRDCALTLPKEIKEGIYFEDEHNVYFKLTKNNFNESRFNMFHLPLLIYNKVSNTFITKKQLGDFEKNIISFHPIYKLTSQLDHLGELLWHFLRQVVDINLKPKSDSILKNPIITTIIIIIFIAIIILVLAPKLFPQIANSVGGIGKTVASSAQTITKTG